MPDEPETFTMPVPPPFPPHGPHAHDVLYIRHGEGAPERTRASTRTSCFGVSRARPR